MKHSEPLVVTKNLLNELHTFAAPCMLEAALQAVLSELGAAASNALTLFSYRAEFKEGAREGDSVQVAIEETAGALPGDREFDVYFSKGEKIGRIGKWHLVFTKRTEGHPLPYRIGLAAADGRTDTQLWKPEPTVATGNFLEDAPSLLWLEGQCARRYMLRLDSEFAAEVKLDDDVETRIYGGIAVVTHLTRWPVPGEILRCAVQYQLPLRQQPRQDRKMVFDGVLVADQGTETYLLGTFRFTVMRLNAQRLSIYPGGATERH